MRILVTGASGLVGSALIPVLQEKGHEIGRLVRRKATPGKNEIYWHPTMGSLDKEALLDFHPEAVIHLAGDPIHQGRWNKKKKQEILDSRVKGTQVLAKTLEKLENPPKVIISSSAIGYYGNRCDEILTEQSKAGSGFLAEVCRQWELAIQPAAQAGIRVVQLRMGMILSPKGGGLKKMLLPFKLGLGGILGNGRQYMSWIAIDDVVGIIQFALENERIQGPVNVVTPQPVTNREFTKILGRVLWRPTCLPMPASTVRMVFGEMADELILASDRVKPGKLEAAGYRFQYPDLREALKHVLKS